MNILFLTLLDFDSLQEHNIYTDLLRQLVRDGHNVYAVSPVERKKKQKTHIIREENATILKLRIGNTQKTNVLEKGLSTITIEPIFIFGIKKYFSSVKFDLVLYSTPPITFCKAVEFVKNRDSAISYLMLKDIFPQNALDLEMMTSTGLKSIIYKYFRNKERRLYSISDRIGCMSLANVEYVLSHNSELNKNKVEVCPNCIEIRDFSLTNDEKRLMREKYDIPLDKKVFVYGGNLGKPQGVPFIIDCLKTQKDNSNVYFLIVGDGTEFSKLSAYVDDVRPKNVKLLNRLPKEDYDRMIAACDVGLIFLDHRFTIPNFPSRLLSYMQAGLPVLACTDINTDIGKVIVGNGFGWWCESDDVNSFARIINQILKADLYQYGINAKKVLHEKYDVNVAIKRIVSAFDK